MKITCFVETTRLVPGFESFELVEMAQLYGDGRVTVQAFKDEFKVGQEVEVELKVLEKK